MCIMTGCEKCTFSCPVVVIRSPQARTKGIYISPAIGYNDNMENERWGRKAVELSECIFYTGGLEAEIPNPVVARDAVDELFTHSDGVSAPFFQELKQLGIRLPEPPIRVVSLTPSPIEIPFLLDGARAFASDMRRLLPSFVE